MESGYLLHKITACIHRILGKQVNLRKANFYMTTSEHCVFNVDLVRHDSSQPWGFRLSGGLNTGRSLTIDTINPNSIAEQCGLRPLDQLISINGSECRTATHDDAKFMMINAGNCIRMVVIRNIQLQRDQLPTSDHSLSKQRLTNEPIGIIPFQNSLIYNKEAEIAEPQYVVRGSPPRGDDNQQMSQTTDNNEMTSNDDAGASYQQLMERAAEAKQPLSSEGRISKSFRALENELEKVSGTDQRPTSIFDLKKQRKPSSRWNT
ncbi:hypothetical protein GJ496_004870 [Pomphorhynchus laevis]|nr:hypothetical protein GJ496_004870 [Pomphorhynchus laevis]